MARYCGEHPTLFSDDAAHNPCSPASSDDAAHLDVGCGHSRSRADARGGAARTGRPAALAKSRARRRKRQPTQPTQPTQRARAHVHQAGTGALVDGSGGSDLSDADGRGAHECRVGCRKGASGWSRARLAGQTTAGDWPRARLAGQRAAGDGSPTRMALSGEGASHLAGGPRHSVLCASGTGQRSRNTAQGTREGGAGFGSGGISFLRIRYCAPGLGQHIFLSIFL